MMPRRIERINQAIRAELSEMLLRQVKDPRLNGFITVTRVDTSSDLRHAEVFVSIIAESAEKDEALQALTHASGFFRRELGQRLKLRYIPSLSFTLDDSIARGTQVLQLINNVSGSYSPLD
jgi:ribosome-binding factor A